MEFTFKQILAASIVGALLGAVCLWLVGAP